MDPTSKEGIYTKLNRHGKKVFVARFKINGKTYRPVLGTAPQMNLRDAVARREELIKEKKGYRVHSGKTIDILFEEYIAYRKDALSESWYYNIERNYNKHLKNIIGNQYPNNVSVEDIQYQIDYLLGKKEEKPKKILKPSTAKQLKDCVSGLYTYLIDQGRKEALKESRDKTDVVTEKVTINIGHMLEIPKFDNKIYFTISEVQAEKLYNTINNELFLNKCDDLEILEAIPSLIQEFGELNNPHSIPVAPIICIMWSLKERDIILEHSNRKIEEYIPMMMSHFDVVKKLEYFYYNYDSKKYDNKFSPNEKHEILENSITFFEKNFYSLRNSEHYSKYQKDMEKEETKKSINYLSYDSIINGLKSNINYKNEAMNPDLLITNKILELLSKLNLNFYTEPTPGSKIYPIIADILSDQLHIEYYLHIEKTQTSLLTSSKAWPSTKDAYENGPTKSYSYLFFLKLIRMHDIGQRNIKRFFLSEYARSLNIESQEEMKILQQLMQDIFYPSTGQHDNAFGIGFNVDNIERAPFLLEETKMVIGGI